MRKLLFFLILPCVYFFNQGLREAIKNGDARAVRNLLSQVTSINENFFLFLLRRESNPIFFIGSESELP